MSQNGVRPDAQMLQQFVPLLDMEISQLELLAHYLLVEEATAGKLLIEKGSREEYSFYLLQGRIQLNAGDRRPVVIEGGTDRAAHPISQLLPRRFQVIALSDVRFLRIDTQLLNNITPKQAMRSYLRGYEVVEDSLEEFDAEESSSGGEFTRYLLGQLQSGKLVLPSLPELAVRIGQSIEDETADSGNVAKIIQSDPAISAKIMKAANSALYGAMSPVENCTDAVVRLGLNTTHSLVLTYTLRDIFRTESKLLKKKMEALWQHSVRTAALSYVLASRDSRFQVEKAMLIGLLHDIGLMAIIQCAAKHPEMIKDDEVLEHAIEQFRGVVGGRILRTWRFPQEFVVAAVEAESWMRDSGDHPDYCDLVIVAQLHSYIGTPMSYRVPPLNETPALAHLGLDELTPAASLSLLAAADDEIAAAESLLRG